MNAVVALLALLVDMAFDTSRTWSRAIDHPVRWIGRLVVHIESRMNDPTAPPDERRRQGVAALMLILAAALLPTLLVTELIRSFAIGWVIEVLIASVLLASRHLARAVADVADRLGIALAGGREAVSHIVGRDTADLDEAGVSGAAIESLAENASDGVVAPVFWLALFGLPGIVFYKAVNTADSMLGHRDGRYGDFGWASAKFDDLVNLVPARLTALLIAAAAALTPGADPAGAVRAARRDAPRHASPNAGWPEAAMAGALGIGLGGPRDYRGATLDLATMGDGRREVGPADIRRALRLYWTALLVLTAGVGAIAAVLTLR